MSPRLPFPSRRPALPAGRRLAGWAVLGLGLPVLTGALAGRRTASLAVDLLLYLGLVLIAGVVGGSGPGLAGAALAALAANYYVIPPVHRLTIAKTEDVVALVMFTAVAVTVSTLVNRSARLAAEARRARAEAGALARSTATLAAEIDPLPALLDQLRAVLALDAVGVFSRRPDGSWASTASSGETTPAPAGPHVMALGEGGQHVLAVRPHEHLTSADRALLDSLAGQLALALAARELQADAARAGALVQADALRTAILRAVSHDLRTPLASIKAAVSSLLGDEVTWPPAAVQQFHVTIDAEADRLNHLVGNLLDMSRLQVGAVELRLGPVALEDVVASALASLGQAAGSVVVDVPETTPLAHADAALLERAVANLVANALSYSPGGAPVVVEGGGAGGEAVLRIVDRGPGVPADERASIVEPFQQRGDAATRGGVGLGLAVANGFVVAMGGRLAFEETPGGGLTVAVVLASHPAPTGPPAPAIVGEARS